MNATTPANEPDPAGVEPAISASGVTKVYGPTVALAGVSLEVAPGEIHGLLGENGAGKSTLVRILAGIDKADGGSLRVLGHDLIADGSVTARDLGCAFIHQDLGLFPSATVAENIGLTKGFPRKFGLIDDKRGVREVQALLDRLDMGIDARAMVGELPLADQTAVAIARALSEGVRVIVLDEPTAYLEERQVRGLMALLRRLRADGVACLLITHRASDVLDICDRLTVLREGQTVAARAVDGLTEDELIRTISGHSPVRHTRARTDSTAEPVFEMIDATGPGFGPVSLKIRPGEIVGVCGLADAGTNNLSRAVFGIDKLDSGELRIGGEPARFRSISEAIAAGIAYVPRERRAEAVIPEMSVRENIFLLSKRQRWKWVSRRDEARRAEDLIARFGVQPPEHDREITTLSGGNQQKVIVARWCETQPRLLVLNEPTAGVDLAAKAEIHQHISRTSREQGSGVLLVSTDFSEIADIADRIYVLYRGNVFAELDGDDASPHYLVTLAYGKEAS